MMLVMVTSPMVSCRIFPRLCAVRLARCRVAPA
jgi:hypothetical protein